MSYIDGQSIQFLCSSFIGTDYDFNWNPNVKNYSERYIYMGHNEPIDNQPYIFCYTHRLKEFDTLVKTLKMMQNKFILIFHNSDDGFQSEHLKLFEELPLLIHIYTQNINVVHPKVSALPIGLCNANAGLQGAYEKEVEKTKNVYFQFTIGTNKVKRQECYDKLIKKGVEWNPNKCHYAAYLLELKKYRYSICPEGHGIDTHRLWESLYMNVIPICKKHILVEYFSKYFPIVLLDDWDDLDLDKLDEIYDTIKIDHKFLTMDHIKNLLESHQLP